MLIHSRLKLPDIHFVAKGVLKISEQLHKTLKKTLIYLVNAKFGFLLAKNGQLAQKSFKVIAGVVLYKNTRHVVYFKVNIYLVHVRPGASLHPKEPPGLPHAGDCDRLTLSLFVIPACREH